MKRRGEGGLGSGAEGPLGSESVSAEGGEVEAGESTRQRLRSSLGCTALEAWVGTGGRGGGRSFQVSPKSLLRRSTASTPTLGASQSVCFRVLEESRHVVTGFL